MDDLRHILFREGRGRKSASNRAESLEELLREALEAGDQFMWTRCTFALWHPEDNQRHEKQWESGSYVPQKWEVFAFSALSITPSRTSVM